MKTRKKWMMLFICMVVSMNMYAGDKTSFLKKQFTASSGYQLNYRILYPLDYSPEKQYPVILFLHRLRINITRVLRVFLSLKDRQQGLMSIAIL